LRKLGGSGLNFVKKPSVLDRNNRLVSKRSQQTYVLFPEVAGLCAGHADDADAAGMTKERDQGDAAETSLTREIQQARQACEPQLAILDLNRPRLTDCSLIPIDVRQLQGKQTDQSRIRDLTSPSERREMQRVIFQMKDRCRQPVYELLGPFRYRSEDGAKAGR
jgi:uncharacterized protein YceK